MEGSDANNHFPDFFDIVKSWIPPRKSMSEAGPTNFNPKSNPPTNPRNLPRDFWMPNHSCRVCYDCESHFNLINRRHHCRLCGRVFCSRCTTFLSCQPRPDQAEGDKVRNFCLKQREKALAGAGKNENGESYLMLSLTLSSVSMESSKTSSTGQTLSTLTSGSASGSNGNDQNSDNAAGEYVRFDQTVGTEACSEMEGLLESGKDDKDTETVCEHYEGSLNRSDDEDDEYSGFRSDLETIQCHNSDDYYSLGDFHNAHEPYQADRDQV